jgi:hypothetical protein
MPIRNALPKVLHADFADLHRLSVILHRHVLKADIDEGEP